MREVFRRIFDGKDAPRTVHLSPSDIAKRSGYDRRNLIKRIHRLVDGKVLIRDGKDYRFNKRYWEWTRDGRPMLTEIEKRWCREQAPKRSTPVNVCTVVEPTTVNTCAVVSPTTEGVVEPTTGGVVGWTTPPMYNAPVSISPLREQDREPRTPPPPPQRGRNRGGEGISRPRGKKTRELPEPYMHARRREQREDLRRFMESEAERNGTHE